MTEKILAVVFLFIKSVVAATGYAGITLLMAIESACIPLPSELRPRAPSDAISDHLLPTRSDVMAVARSSKDTVNGFSWDDASSIGPIASSTVGERPPCSSDAYCLSFAPLSHC